MGLRASVAMCTFQGAGYLQEQLTSLERQTRLPDELIVCDDGSSDDTLKLLERFRSRSPFPVQLHRNPRRLGPAKSFERAVSLCGGDVIFLCDQDDVWSPIKVDRMVRTFESSPEAAGAFSDAALLDEEGHALGTRLWTAIGINRRWQQRFSRGDQAMRVRLLAQRNAVSGAAFAFRSRFRDLVLPIPQGWGHDEWIALLLAAAADLRMLALPLIGYRIHPKQRIGLGRSRSWSARWRSMRSSPDDGTGRRRELLARADLLDLARERLSMQGEPEQVSPTALSVLASHARHLRTRGRSASRGGRVGMVLGELVAGRYHRHGRGWASAIRDLLE